MESINNKKFQKKAVRIFERCHCKIDNDVN